MARKMLIQVRRDTAANWTSTNPTLAAGEPGFETDTGKMKWGDGATAWNSLAYPSGSGDVATDLIWDTKGDIAVASGSNAADNLPVGSSGQVLTADPGETLGVKWATPTTGSGGSLLYDYVVAGSDKASIDTQVDDGGNGAAALPTAYVALEILVIARTDEAVFHSGVGLRFNNDTGSNYDFNRIQGLDTTLSGAATVAASRITLLAAGTSTAANYAGASRVTIPGYAGTTFYKSATIETGSPDSSAASNQHRVQIGAWRSTSAITRVSITPATGGVNLKVGSRLMIFGIGSASVDGGTP